MSHRAGGDSPPPINTERINMNYDLLILRAMDEHGWKRNFATEYVMARYLHGMSHARAMKHALSSPYLKKKDLP